VNFSQVIDYAKLLQSIVNGVAVANWLTIFNHWR